MNLNVNGIKVKGRIIERKKHLITVEILAPFNGLFQSATDEHLIGGTCDYIGDYGTLTARKLLYDLYDFCLYIHNNADYVKKHHAELIAERDKIREEMLPIIIQRNELKISYNNNLITEKDYKLKLKLLQELKEPYSIQLRNLHIPPPQVINYVKDKYGE